MLNEIYALVMYSAVLSNSQESERPYKSLPTAPLPLENRFAIREEEFEFIPPARRVQNNNIRASRNTFQNSSVQESYPRVITNRSFTRAKGRNPSSA